MILVEMGPPGLTRREVSVVDGEERRSPAPLENQRYSSNAALLANQPPPPLPKRGLTPTIL